jgi:hypothetical protein
MANEHATPPRAADMVRHPRIVENVGPLQPPGLPARRRGFQPIVFRGRAGMVHGRRSDGVLGAADRPARTPLGYHRL